MGRRFIAPGLALLGFAVTFALTMPGRWWERPGRAIPVSTPRGQLLVQRPSQTIRPAGVPAMSAAQNMPVNSPAPPAVTIPDSPALQPLPVRVTFPFEFRHRSEFEPSAGRAVQIVPTADEPLTVVVEISNEAAGKRDQRVVLLDPHRVVKLGEADGWAPQPGDQIKLHADGYAEVVRRIL